MAHVDNSCVGCGVCGEVAHAAALLACVVGQPGLAHGFHCAPVDRYRTAILAGRDPREIRFIGDMPHAWVASDFVRGALDMFAWDRRDDQALVLGGGLSKDWLVGRGSTIRGLATPYGSLDFAMRGTPARLVASVGGSARPPGGFSLAWPFAGPLPAARIDGRPARWVDRTLNFPATGRPIRIEVGQ